VRILHFEFATDFVLYYSHDCHLPARLQFWQDTPQIGSRREETRRCGVSSQRWRFTVRAVSGHGPAMHSTRLHANAAAAAGDDQVNVVHCDGNAVSYNSTRTHFDEQKQRLQQELHCCRS
jgi:hypothetical protein